MVDINSLKGKPYVLISSDAHAGADVLAYKPYLEKRWHEEFDAWAGSVAGTWDDLNPDSEYKVGVSSYLSPINWQSKERLELLESFGIAAEVIFPNTAQPFYPVETLAAAAPRTGDEYERRWAGLQAHNRWLADFCSEVSGRRAGLVQLFLNDVDAAVAEVRWAAENGLKGVLLPPDHHLHLINLYYPSLDPLWAVCSELGMPVHRHGIVVSNPEEGRPDSKIAAQMCGTYESGYFGQRSLFQLVLSGVFERFPTLKFVFTELGESTWVLPEMERMDAWVELCRGDNVLAMFGREAADRLSMLPSEYCNRNVYYSSLVSTREVSASEEIGIDRMLWGADFPHHEGTAPYVLEGLRLGFQSASEDVVRRITSLNSAEVYNLDLDLLQTVADRIGPTPEQVATPLSAEDIPSGLELVIGVTE
jgi:predicted TIM-barrel fold metal-dependent hydrolase